MELPLRVHLFTAFLSCFKVSNNNIFFFKSQQNQMLQPVHHLKYIFIKTLLYLYFYRYMLKWHNVRSIQVF